MSCKTKPKYTCGDMRQNARCVFFDLTPPEFSKLNEEECLTTEETIDDLYKIVSDLRERTDMSSLDSTCLEISKTKSKYDKELQYKVSDVLVAISDKLCELEGTKDEDESLNLDFKCLTTSCGDPITTLKDLLQTIIDEICNLKSE